MSDFYFVSDCSTARENIVFALILFAIVAFYLVPIVLGALGIFISLPFTLFSDGKPSDCYCESNFGMCYPCKDQKESWARYEAEKKANYVPMPERLKGWWKTGESALVFKFWGGFIIFIYACYYLALYLGY